MYVCHRKLPRFQVIEIEALSIRENCYHQSGIDVEEKILFRVENHDFAGEEFERFISQDIWSNPWNFETLWNPLECWNILETPYK